MIDLSLYFAFAALIFGTIVGSFLNAFSFRFNTGRTLSLFSTTSSGRSRCMHCRHVLGALDLVPIVSYLFLRGRCRYCGAKISIQYPLVEATAAALSLLCYLSHPQPLSYAFWLLVWMVLLFIVVYDIRHTVIPWSASGTLAFLAIASLFLNLDSIPQFVFPHSLMAILAGPLLALPLAGLSLVSMGRWMGWGDGPLELSLGWMLGLTQGITALMLAFWIGAAVGISLIFIKKGLTMKSELPFAPFLVLGAAIVHFFHVDFFTSLPLLW
jgi:leader peptidase (prepilin peptidase)/N-methyltransferase